MSSWPSARAWPMLLVGGFNAPSWSDSSVPYDEHGEPSADPLDPGTWAASGGYIAHMVIKQPLYQAPDTLFDTRPRHWAQFFIYSFCTVSPAIEATHMHMAKINNINKSDVSHRLQHPFNDGLPPCRAAVLHPWTSACHGRGSFLALIRRPPLNQRLPRLFGTVRVPVVTSMPLPVCLPYGPHTA